MNQEKEKTPASREERIKWYKDQIEMASLVTELSKLNSRRIVYEAERLEALERIARFGEKSPQRKNDGDGVKSNPKEEKK